LHGRESPGAELDAFAVPSHPPGGFEREIGSGFYEYRHDPVPYLAKYKKSVGMPAWRRDPGSGIDFLWIMGQI